MTAIRQRLILLLLLPLAACGGNYADEGAKAFTAGRFRDAVDFLEVALSEAESPQTRFFLGAAYRRIGRAKDAVRVLKPLLSSPEFGLRSLHETVSALVTTDELEEADELVKAAIKKSPEDADVLQALARIQEINTAEVRKAIAKMLELHLGKSQARRSEYQVGRIICSKAGSFEQAFARGFASLKNGLGFDDKSTLHDLTKQANRLLRETEETCLRIVALNPLAFQSHLFLTDVAFQRRNLKVLTRHAKGVIAVDAGAIENPERRQGLPAAKLKALELARRGFETEEHCDAGIEWLKTVESRFSKAATRDAFARLYYLGNHPEPLAALSSNWLLDEPQNQWASFYRGWSLCGLKKFSQAVPYLERARDASPQTAAFNRMLGIAHVRTGNQKRGLPYLLQALDLDPHDHEVLIDVSIAYEKMGETEKARSILLESVRGLFKNRLKPGHKEIMARLVDQYQQAGRGIKSLKQAKLLHDEDRENPFVALRLAQLESEDGNYPEANRIINRTQRTFPNLPDSWRVGADIALAHNNWYAAMTYLDRLDKLEPTDAVGTLLRAQALILQRRYDEAAIHARLALERDPDSAQAGIILVEIEMAQKQWRNALTVGQTVRNQFQDNAEILKLLGKAHEELKEWGDAASIYGALIEMEPGNSKAYSDFGVALLKAHRISEAAAPLRKAHELTEKENFRQRVGIAKSLTWARDYETSIEAFSSLIKDLDRDDPLRPGAIVGLGQAHHYAGNPLGLTDASLALRRSAHSDQAWQLFLNMSAQAKAWPEALAAFQTAEREGEVSVVSSKAGLSAALNEGKYALALRIIGELERHPALRGAQLRKERAQALMGMNKSLEAEGRLEKDVHEVGAQQRGELWELRVRNMLKRSRSQEVIPLLAVIREDASGHAGALYEAALACIKQSKFEDAERLLQTSWRLRPTHEDTSLALCGLKARRGDFKGAAQALTRVNSPAAIQARGLARVLGNQAPENQRSLAGWLWKLQKKDYAGAAKLSPMMGDIPRTLRIAFGSLGTHLGTTKGSTQSTVNALASSLLLAQSKVYPGTSLSILANAVKRSPQEKPWLDIWKIWLHVVEKNGLAVASEVTPMIAQGNKNALTVYLACRAGLLNAGPANVKVLLNRMAGLGQIPEELALDLGALLNEEGEHSEALKILNRASNPGPATAQAKVLTLVSLGRLDEAAVISERLPKALKIGGKISQFLAVWAIASDSSANRTEVGRRMKPLVSKPHPMLSPIIQFQGAVRARLVDEANDAARRALLKPAYRTATFVALANALENAPMFLDLKERLEGALSVVDPRGALRARAKSN